MIYVGLGTGSLIERNKARMSYVNRLAQDTNKLETLVDELFIALDSNNFDNVDIAIKQLFYEKINFEYITKLIELHSKLDCNSREILKCNVLSNYRKRPVKGFKWNLFGEYWRI